MNYQISRRRFVLQTADASAARYFRENALLRVEGLIVKGKKELARKTCQEAVGLFKEKGRPEEAAQLLASTGEILKARVSKLEAARAYADALALAPKHDLRVDWAARSAPALLQDARAHADAGEWSAAAKRQIKAVHVLVRAERDPLKCLELIPNAEKWTRQEIKEADIAKVSNEQLARLTAIWADLHVIAVAQMDRFAAQPQADYAQLKDVFYGVDSPEALQKIRGEMQGMAREIYLNSIKLAPEHEHSPVWKKKAAELAPEAANQELARIYYSVFSSLNKLVKQENYPDALMLAQEAGHYFAQHGAPGEPYARVMGRIKEELHQTLEAMTERMMADAHEDAAVAQGSARIASNGSNGNGPRVLEQQELFPESASNGAHVREQKDSGLSD